MSQQVGMLHDPDAERRSLMLQRKVLCNGQATGVRCTHYWTFLRNEPSANVDALSKGGKVRLCRAWGDSEPLEFGEGTSELTTLAPGEPPWKGCSSYFPAGAKAKKHDGDAESALVHIRRKGIPDRYRYDPSFEGFDESMADAVAQRFVDVPLDPSLTRSQMGDVFVDPVTPESELARPAKGALELMTVTADEAASDEPGKDDESTNQGIFARKHEDNEQ